jgi:CRP-like cAMP-binding protein
MKASDPKEVEQQAIRHTLAARGALFSRLPDATLAELASALEVRLYADGEVLFEKGDPGDEMFIVQEGSVAIYEPSPDEAAKHQPPAGTSPPAKERPLRIFRAGESLGEMALIDNLPRTLSARAVLASQTLVLKGDDFRRLVRDPNVALAVMAGQNDRIRYTTEFLGQVREWMGRIAAGQHETAQFLNDMQEWVRQVAQDEYVEPAETSTQYRDRTMATLAAEFARMATQVKHREDLLRREIADLKIEIDEAKRKKQVAEITESDYFQSLKTQARELRRKRK